MTSILFFFFFQAEDGIRDLTVTGVQTCALPISRPAVPQIRNAKYAVRNPIDSFLAERLIRDKLEPSPAADKYRSEEHTSELQSQSNLVCRLLLEKKKHTHGPDATCLDAIVHHRL